MRTTSSFHLGWQAWGKQETFPFEGRFLGNHLHFLIAGKPFPLDGIRSVRLCGEGSLTGQAQDQGVYAREHRPGSGRVCEGGPPDGVKTCPFPEGITARGGEGRGVCGYCRALSLHRPLPSLFLLQPGQEDFLSSQQEGGRAFLSAGILPLPPLWPRLVPCREQVAVSL